MKSARYNYRFYPTPTQEVELAKLFGCVRVVFNWGLESGFNALSREENVPSMATLSGLLTKMKKTEQYAWLNEVSCVPLQQCLRHLSSAWRHCFSKRAKRPRFKSRRDKQSAEFTRSAMKVNAQVVTLAKISGPLELRWSRSLPSPPPLAQSLKIRRVATMSALSWSMSLSKLLRRPSSLGWTWA